MSIVLNTYSHTRTLTQTGYKEFTEVSGRVCVCRYTIRAMKSEQSIKPTHTSVRESDDREGKKEKTVNHNFLPCFGIYVFMMEKKISYRA